MDIDVKNAYTKAVKACGPELGDILSEDIYRFINYISLDDAEARFETFRKIYIQSDVNVNAIDISDNKPQTIARLMNEDIENTSAIVAFFMTLGKYYLFSRFDKKAIDKDKYTNYIKEIGNVTSEAKKYANTGSNSVKKESTVKINSAEVLEKETNEEKIES